MSVTNQDTDITWRYVDCQGAAIKALRDYATMEAIIASTPDDLKAIKADVPSLSSPKLDGSRGCFNPPPTRARIRSCATWNASTTAPANTCKQRITWTGSAPHGKRSPMKSARFWRRAFSLAMSRY